MKETLCRPDDMHWCTECCPSDCPLLGDTGGGKMGCLGHNGKRTPEGLTERSTCLELDCLAEFLPEDKEIIRRTISKMPPGRFKMSEVLAGFKIGRRVCAWCNRVMGKRLNINGDIHVICEDCFEAERLK